MSRATPARRRQRRGCEVLAATDGEHGSRQAAAERPGLSLMGMRLPVVDGWAATRRLSTAPATAAIPIIGTAHAIASDRDRCLAAGCDDCGPKPVELARLRGAGAA